MFSASGIRLVSPTRSLAWDAVAGADAYKVYVGTSPGTYSQNQNVGNVTTLALGAISPPLNANTTYYLAAAALQGATESAKSNEIIVKDSKQLG